eukprot:TRINITY_DN4255_c0_g1_i6.p1 TRINITY_DN4255_c0_g1~~TRINITY_DN4255_c0_g1_i6.p1  ORF type:complete len:195 (-),score=18.74 TRINITY_DN4255_c0_g1_i6:331-915(-)
MANMAANPAGHSRDRWAPRLVHAALQAEGERDRFAFRGCTQPSTPVSEAEQLMHRYPHASPHPHRSPGPIFKPTIRYQRSHAHAFANGESVPWNGPRPGPSAAASYHVHGHAVAAERRRRDFGRHDEFYPRQQGRIAACPTRTMEYGSARLVPRQELMTALFDSSRGAPGAGDASWAGTPAWRGAIQLSIEHMH